MMEQQKERVSVSLGKKINCGNYESVDIHYSYSTDLLDSETPQAAFKRAEEEVAHVIKEKTKEIKEALAARG